MSDINFKGDEVCYANGLHHVVSGFLDDDLLQHCLTFDDFQLNEIREGDFIPASELDTEQKYNEVVEVFELFGFGKHEIHLGYNKHNSLYFTATNVGYCYSATNGRQLTYHQIIAIGKLKRMMLEREKSAPKTTADLTEGNADQVKNPKHYQLIEGVESIEVIARSMTKEQWKGFCLGNMLKYRIRAGKKDALQQDIEKANFYGELYEMHKEKCYD